MWCPYCESEVAAKSSAETDKVLCAECGAEIPAGKPHALDDQLKQARDLLERWSKEPLLEPSGTSIDKKTSHLSPDDNMPAPEEELPQASEPTARSQAPEVEPPDEALIEELLAPPPKPALPPEKRPKYRFDAAHQPQPQASEESSPEESAAAESNEAIEPPDAMNEAEVQEPEPAVASHQVAEPAEPPPAPINKRYDDPQPQAAAAPHFDIQELIEQRQKTKKGVNWMLLAGQWLSYLGVLGLTAGASMVIYGYFGGATDLAPKGWMLTTAGQMLLFLGIVTLISSGMEKSNEEVTERIEIIGDQLLRFERETKEQLLRGPKIAAAVYSETGTPQPSNSNQKSAATTDQKTDEIEEQG